MMDSVYYYYQRLAAKERAAYDHLLQGMVEMKPEIDCPGQDFDSMDRTVEYIRADHPELFWLGVNWRMKQHGDRFSVLPNYSMNSSERGKVEKNIETIVSEFLRNASSLETDIARLEKAYQYLIERVDYDKNTKDDQTICGALINKRSVCAGYAKSLQYLLQRMGIESIFVSGDIAHRGGHAWNIVKLGEEYYHTDVTFGDRSFSDDTETRNGLPKALEADYAFLCMSDKEALCDRTMDQIKGIKLPHCYRTDMSRYRRHNLYFQNAGDAWSYIKRRLSSGHHYWCIQFDTRNTYHSFYRELSEGKFADLALERLNIKQVATRTSRDDIRRSVVGWIE